MTDPDGYFVHRNPTRPKALLAPALIMMPEEAGTLGFAGPLVPLGLLISCCANACNGALELRLTTPVAEAARLIAIIHEHADRYGYRYALESALDQQRAWIRHAPPS